MFSKNLDFIMNLTNTSASALGAVCHLDPSHISRLRVGSRPLLKKPDFLHSMSEYLVKRIVSDYQKNALCGALNINVLPEEISLLTELVENWLVSSELPKEESPDVSRLIESFSATHAARQPEPEHISDISDIKNYYYGVKGKQEAVLCFFELILKQKEHQTLLIFSDEDMTWLFDDNVFAAKWFSGFSKVLKAGNRVKIIHNTGRKMNEMLEAIAKWIPVYMTGMIEPYYYPRKRDGVFQRTLFMAPETVAVTSVSVTDKTENSLNELITDKSALKALTFEFENYFALCRPLMNIILPSGRNGLWKVHDALTEAEGSIICMSDMPTLVTMPYEVAEEMQKRAPQSCILERKKILSEYIESLSGKKDISFTEILPDSFDPSVPPLLPCAELLGADGLCYTKEEWRLHTENCALFAQKHKGYIQIRRGNVPKDITLIVKENTGVIMTKNVTPCVAFALSEQNLVNSFYDYILRYL